MEVSLRYFVAQMRVGSLSLGSIPHFILRWARLSARTLDFRSSKRGSTPLLTTNLYQSVGKSGRSRLPWKEELGGSNPPTLTIKGRPTDSCLRHTRKVGWAAYAGFGGFPDIRKTTTLLLL